MLLIDVGNTRFKAAFAGELDLTWAVVKDAEDPAAGVAQLLDLCYRQPAEVVISCVGDSANAERLQSQCMARWGLVTQRLQTAARFGKVTNGYADYRQLGIDRWAAVVAAWHQVRGAVVVVDCGTAVTIDTVANDGRHLGGVIIPGLRLSAGSFFRHTHNMANQPIGERQLFATDTGMAVSSGVRWAVAGGINSVLSEVLQQLPPDTQVLLTGGDAAELLPYLRVDVTQDEYLVFRGMALIAGF